MRRVTGKEKSVITFEKGQKVRLTETLKPPMNVSEGSIGQILSVDSKRPGVFNVLFGTDINDACAVRADLFAEQLEAIAST